MKKQLTALALCGALAIGALSGCAVNVADMGTAGGTAIPMDDFDTELQTQLSSFLGQHTDIENWDSFNGYTDENGKSAKDIVLDATYETFQKNALVKKLCSENEVTMDDTTADSYTKQQYSQYEAYGITLEQIAQSSGMTVEQLYAASRPQWYEYALQEKLYPEEITEPTDAEMKAIYESDYVRVKHILFKTVDDDNNPLDDAAVAEKKQQAQDTLDKIRNGEDFENFLSLSEDPGTAANPDGYVFTYNQMVQAFEEASFALKDGEVSDLVESSYGYHIIKRYDKNENDSFYEGVKDAIKSSIQQEQGNEQYTANREKLDTLLTEQLSSIEVKRDTGRVNKIDFKGMLDQYEKNKAAAAESAAAATSAESSTAEVSTSAETSTADDTPEDEVKVSG